MGALAGELGLLPPLPDDPAKPDLARPHAAPSAAAASQPDPAALFGHAQALHRAGKLAEAAAAHRALLAREPGHLQAKHYLGVLAHQAGRSEDAIALIRELDLIVTVDTSVAHLAGTLGTSTWLLLPFAPDWRWLAGRADSPWYPATRLFRQAALGDWPGVVAQVRKALRAHTTATDAVGDPPPAAGNDQGGGTST